jgi:ribonuclease E
MGEAVAAPAEEEAGEAEETDERAGAFEQAASADARGESERRRRRRGRRGGRRNKRDREGPFLENGAVEPELTSAVADFDQPFAAFAAEPFAAEPFAAEPSAPETAPQPDIRQADVVPPPVETQPEAPLAQESRHAEPMRPVPIPPVEPPVEPEPPRKRSTVREPAPFAIGSGDAPVTPVLVTPPPASAPVAAESEGAEDTDQPRRTGWWAKRLMGGQKR